MCSKPDLTHLHLDEAERVVFLHEGLDAGAGVLQTGLVLADPGDVFLNGRPVGVTVRARAFPQSAGEGEDRRIHVVTQVVQDPLAVLHVLLQEEISEEGGDKGDNCLRHTDIPCSASPSPSAPGASSQRCCTSSRPCTAAYPGCPGEDTRTTASPGI